MSVGKYIDLGIKSELLERFDSVLVAFYVKDVGYDWEGLKQ